MKVRVSASWGLLATLVLWGGIAPEAPVADAAMRGDVEEVEALLRSGADVNAAQGDGMTALHWAAELGLADLAETLIAAGAFVDAVTRLGDFTALHVAARAGHGSVVRALVGAGADVTARTSTGGVTPLHYAAAAGSTDAVRALVPGAAALLAPAGTLVLEVGAGQAEAAADEMRAAGLGDLRVVPDLAGIERIVCARREG